MRKIYYSNLLQQRFKKKIGNNLLTINGVIIYE